MYNYDVNVEYNIEEDDLKNYQKYFLKVFNIESYDNIKINQVFDFLTEKIENKKEFKHIFEKEYQYAMFLGNDIKSFFMPVLFSYQSFKYMHACLKELFTSDKISSENIKLLENSLNYLLKK